jgi:hypothetical protein
VWYEGGTKHGALYPVIEDDATAPSTTEHRSRATRFRALAAAATTLRTKAYLLAMARHSDALAEGRLAVAPVTLDDEQDRTARRGPFR